MEKCDKIHIKSFNENESRVEGNNSFKADYKKMELKSKNINGIVYKQLSLLKDQKKEEK